MNRICRNIIGQSFRPSNVFMTQWPLIWMCRTIGLLPLVIVTKKSVDSIRVSPFCLVFPFILVGIFSFSFVVTIARGDSFSTYFVPTDLSELVSFAQLTIFFMSVVTIYVSIFWNRQKLVRLFVLFDVIDGKLTECYDVRVPYAKSVRYMLTVIGVHSILFILKWLLTYLQQMLLDRTPTWNIWVSYFFSHIILFSATIKFMCIVEQLHCRYRLLNQVSLVYKTN